MTLGALQDDAFWRTFHEAHPEVDLVLLPEVEYGLHHAYEQHVQPVIDTVTGTAVGTYETVTHGAGVAWDTAQSGFDAVWPDSWP
ncbi:MAG: hypothetical protein JWO76_2890 [Nocardioides sp.]|nr:hypothetical protein [Nocardioides sp.]